MSLKIVQVEKVNQEECVIFFRKKMGTNLGSEKKD